MKRLSKNGEIILDGTAPKNEKIKEALTLLGKYQDIEEEIGIDLLTFFKAFNGLWYKKEEEIKFSCHIAVVDWAIYILEESFTIGDGVKLYFEGYGKTWALTKEELE